MVYDTSFLLQRQAGTSKIGGAAKQAARKAPKPLQNAFKSSKAQAKQAPKKAGGFFGLGKAASPKQVLLC